MNTAELLIQCLENEGVQYVFGLPGEENLHVLEALKSSSIQFITTRHEQGAAFMADVYGRLTGRAGVCLSTLGPGATNLMTGVADANLDGAPLVAITGQVGTDQMHIEAHQYLDLVAMFAPVTKWNTQIVRPSNTPEIVRRAFKRAQSEKPGAVHIDLPENIAAMEAVGQPLKKDKKDSIPTRIKEEINDLKIGFDLKLLDLDFLEGLGLSVKYAYEVEPGFSSKYQLRVDQIKTKFGMIL